MLPLLRRAVWLPACRSESIFFSRVEGRGSRVEGRGSRVEGRGSRVEGRGSRVEGRGSRVEGRGSRVEGRARVEGKTKTKTTRNLTAYSKFLEQSLQYLLIV